MTTISLYDDLSLTVSEAGTGRPALILHGGGGPATVAGSPGTFIGRHTPSRLCTPAGTARPALHGSPA
ncbi:hypothetical protein [Microbispora sp. GKU 823]|uniref:hypothetical protein n=1 Tax=Microbispora sp. GKU 823 TaxID=1652100 RepID=UPI001C4E0025|nr:hypothetical protein [Microbispora sp. GKU 823]